jgi:hypothetical protein
MLSGLPIVSRAWVESIRRRLLESDPQLRSYHAARYILAEIFGEEWGDRNIGEAGDKSFFRDARTSEGDAYTHFMRVTGLAEMLLNLQSVSGYNECAAKLKTSAMIEPTFAELEVGKILYVSWYPV